MNTHEEALMHLSTRELELLEQGLARVYRGRLIPVMRGGDLGDAAAAAAAAVEPPVVLPISEVTPPPAAVEPVVPVAEPEVVPAVVEPPAPEPLTQEQMLEAMQQAAAGGTSQAFNQMLEQAAREEAARAAATPQPLPEWDPYDPNVVVAHMATVFGPMFERINAALAPALAVADRYQQSEGEREARAVIDATKAEGDPELEYDRIVFGARQLVAQGVQPETAMKQSYASELAREKAAEDRGAAAALARLGIVAEAHMGAGAEPASGGGAGAEPVVIPRGKGSYESQLHASLARMGRGPGLSQPTG